MIRVLMLLVSVSFSSGLWARPPVGIPASDTLGAEDLAGNPTFIGGVANGGGTAHGVW